MNFTRRKKEKNHWILHDVDYRMLPEKCCDPEIQCGETRCDPEPDLTRIQCRKDCDVAKYTLDLYVPKTKCKVCHTAVIKDYTGDYNVTEKDENYYLKREKSEHLPLQKELKEESTTSPPVVIFVHGGGWKRGHKQAWKHYLSLYDTNILVAFLLQFANVYSNIGEMYAKNGIACAIITYPLGKTQPFWLLMESFMSFVASTLFLGILSMTFIGFFYIFMMTANIKWVLSHSMDSLPSFGFLIYFLTVIAWTQILTYIIILWRRRSYKLTPIQSLLPLLLIIKMISTSYYTHFPGHSDLQRTIIANCLFITLVIQGSIAYIQLTKIPEGCYSQQMEALGMAVKWVKTLGETTGIINPKDIYLMGHSAGGHLVSMTTLNEKCLLKTGCSKSDIKGVISMSGVYDISCLNTKTLKNLYITPTFGEKEKDWIEASPLNMLDHKVSLDGMPPFLVLCAEWDMALADQAEEFSRKLKQNGVLAQFHKISGTNHFTITVNVGSKWDSTAGKNIEQLCLNLINN